jgi:hypothetical protein
MEESLIPDNDQFYQAVGRATKFSFQRLVDLANILIKFDQDVKGEIGSFLSPGTFWGDILLLRQDKEGKDEALERLTSKYFTRRRLFHPDRWDFLFQHFILYARDNRHSVIFGKMARSNLYIALHDQEFENVPATEIYQFLRREVRKLIEKDLLSGETLDQFLVRTPKLRSLPEEDPIVTKRINQQVQEELFTMGDRIDAILRMQNLPDDDVQLILDYFKGFTDKELASRMGVSPAAIRKRRSRVYKKLQS